MQQLLSSLEILSAHHVKERHEVCFEVLDESLFATPRHQQLDFGGGSQLHEFKESHLATVHADLVYQQLPHFHLLVDLDGMEIYTQVNNVTRYYSLVLFTLLRIQIINKHFGS